MKSLTDRFLCSLVVIGLISPFALAQGKKGASSTSSAASQTPQPATPASPSTAAFESQMLAYGALDHIAKSIAKTVCSEPYVDRDNSTIVIYDQASFANLQSFEAFVANIKSVGAAYQTLIRSEDRQKFRDDIRKLLAEQSQQNQTMANKREAGSEIKKRNQHTEKLLRFTSETLSVSFDPFADLISLLSAVAISSNVETPGQITIPDSNMAVALTREIKATCKSKKLTIIYPPLFGSGSSTDYSSADIQTEIQKLDDIRAVATRYVDDRNTTFVPPNSSQTTTGSTTPPPKTEPLAQTQTTKSTVTGSATATGDSVLVAALADINTLYDSFMNSLLQVNSSTGVIGSASVIQGFQLATLLRGIQSDCQVMGEVKNRPEDPLKIPEWYSNWYKSPAFILLASIANAGGTERDHKTIWTALSSGDVITYSGGVIVNVALWQADSIAPIYSSPLRFRVPFSDVIRPVNLNGVDAGDNLPK